MLADVSLLSLIIFVTLKSMRTLRQSKLFAANTDPTLEKIVNTPDIDLHTVNVAFNLLEDKSEYEYLNGLPTSFVLTLMTAASCLEKLVPKVVGS